MTKIDKVLDKLESANIIGKHNFDIDEKLLNFYIRLYSALGDSNSKFDYCLARRLAGLNLLKYKLNNYRHYEIKEGFIYVISNPAWKGLYKIGKTIDLNKRLANLQTGDPFRSYKVESYEFVLDRHKTEKFVLLNLSKDLSKGEWVDKETYETIMRLIVSTQVFNLTNIKLLSKGRNFNCKVL